jgi:aminoglycoside phosphotransferase (APT) family kinase protein
MSSTETIDMRVETGLSRIASRIDPGAEAIHGLARLSGGATQEIWRFELGGSGEDSARYILRRAPGGTRITEGVGLEVEAQLMAAAAHEGVPVAEVVYVLAPEDGLGRGFVMRFVEGETLGGRIVKSPDLEAARQTLAAECGAIMARIHKLAPEDFPTLDREPPAEMVERWRAAYRETLIRRPVFDLAFRWLADQAPPPVEPRLVHGDFRNGNLMIGPDGVRAVLDWELAHIGDPMEDLGWICVNSWRFGRIDFPVGGFGKLDDLISGYEAASGARVDRASLRWWEAFGTIRWGVICAKSIASYRGEDPTMERAMIARRTSETEIDLLRLIAS